MNLPINIQEAYQRIRPYILQTPLIYSPYLSEKCKGKVYLKMESEQYTGSFKARGAMHKLLCLKERGIRENIITASTGNHGMGVARALGMLGMEGTIVIPSNTVQTKQEALNAYGATVKMHGDDCLVSEQYARQLSEEEGWSYVSPYNDIEVIAGQGTIAIEIEQQLAVFPDEIFITIGGGGLISGIGSYVKDKYPATKIRGCQPILSPEMTLSVRLGTYKTVKNQETLSDASAGAFEKDAITYPLCQQVVDDFTLITEQEIAETIRLVLAKERKLIEGAAAVAVASLLRNPPKEGATSVVVICGGNISSDKLKKVFSLNRPVIPQAKVHEQMSDEERFQNETLRPIIKLQHPLFIAIFKRYMANKKNAFFDLPIEKRAQYIHQILSKDVIFRNQLIGTILGQFSVEEYQTYSQHATALNRRMIHILKERMIDCMQELLV